MDTAAGDQFFYAEAADLAALDVVALRRALNLLVTALHVVNVQDPDGAPTASTLGNVPVALLDVRTISGEDTTSSNTDSWKRSSGMSPRTPAQWSSR